MAELAHNAVLPMHPPPFEDETLSSWLMRLARANGTKFYSLCRWIQKSNKNIGRKLDIGVPRPFIHRLAYLTGLTERRVMNTTLDSFIGFLVPGLQKHHHFSGILMAGIERYAELRYLQQFCPLCLRDSNPFFRKSWRITFITACVKHEIRLQDRCPQCQAPVVPFKNDTKNQSIPFEGQWSECFKCGFDVKYAPILRAEREVVRSTKLINSILKKGYWDLGNGEWIYSFSFFSVLKHLMRLVIYKERKPYSKVQVDSIDVDMRYWAFSEMNQIFDLWPDNFIRFAESHGLFLYDFYSMYKTNPVLPFWLVEPLKEHRHFPKVAPESDHVKCACAYLKANGKKVNKYSISRLLGVCNSFVIDQIFDQEK
ncbi:TniQ family protein [Planctobacterium marinum]|uniref:TniQ family protein n=1 Tax=Planctobacterium marinum TaxID=1631968 RepID=UPI001E42918C|nr:TniQ family protein [Planctobacterium marinum]MCC2606572.1 TniQ family protein [Planctobacterium marinum]